MKKDQLKVKDKDSLGPIDIVYTWVNGEDPDYIQVCKKYAEKPEEINPERYRDTYQFLKYSLRSIEKYAPWIRQVFIITARPQVPEWLKTSCKKVRIIHHDEIIDQEYLPTFNYNTIESFMHKIPGLSEHYIYMCDDFLFGNQIKRSDFYHDNKITVFGTLLGENLPFRIYERKNDIISLGLIEHNPIFYRKTYVNELQEHFKEQFHKTRSSKFRANDNITMQKAYKYYMLKHQKEFSRPINVFDLKGIHTFHKIKNNLNKQIKKLDKLENKRPKFYCLNDDQRENPNPEVVKLVKEFLERSYPEKSSFERIK